MAIYIGVNGQAKKVKSAYIGDTYGSAKPIYKSNIVPDDYIPVEYIFNNHTNINKLSTGITCNDYTRVVLKFACPSSPGSANGITILKTGSSVSFFVSLTSSYSRAIRVWIGSGTYESNYDSNVHTVDINRNIDKETYFDNTKVFTNNSTGINGSIELLNDECTNGIYIYSLTIYQSMIDGTLTKNFIPCIRKSDGRAGMWESVNKSFYGGSAMNSTDYFSPGPVITS